jgi:putative aminopeptidase FrvX
MTSREFCRIAGRLMRTPAVPYHEAAVRGEVESICKENGLTFERDVFGNCLVRLKTHPRARAIALAAHMDHPGFEIVGRNAAVPLKARFLGGVPDRYFRKGIRLRLMPGNVRASLGRAMGKKEFEVNCARKLSARPQFAIWELEDFRVDQDLIRGRACDDLIGVAAILATLIELKRRRAQVHVIGVVSRAEEVGFHGALALAAAGTLPEKTLVISLETSRELPGVRMGQGVILRVGDRASIFDSTATRFLAEVAAKKIRGKRPLKWQRALMSGGTCEATAYQQFGYQTAAVCVALGNYHNCGPNDRVAAEYVSTGDALAMVELLAAAACEEKRFLSLTQRLPERLLGLLRIARRKLGSPQRGTQATGEGEASTLYPPRKRRATHRPARRAIPAQTR